MTNTKIVYPENLAYAVEIIKDHIDEVVADASGGGNTKNDKDGDDAIDTETINQILVQTGFPAIT
jgi:hypothetical protein